MNTNKWLRLTSEEALESDIPICDAHHHFWDFKEKYAPYQRYLLHELVDDIKESGHDVRSTVYVEATSMYTPSLSKEFRSVGEVEFAQGLAAASASGLYGKTRAAAAIVGQANLNLGDQVEPVLEALKLASPNRFRGIRHRVAWDRHPEVENTAPHIIKEQLLNDNFRRGAKVLAHMRLSFEALVFFHQLPELAGFAKANPELIIIINHIGGLLRIGPYSNNDQEVNSIWRRGIDLVSKFPNVYMKLGGIGMIENGFKWHERKQPIGSVELSSDMAPYINYCIERFSPSRCMFESNFPVDKISYSYGVLFNAFKRVSQAYSNSERRAMFHDNAVDVYQIEL